MKRVLPQAGVLVVYHKVLCAVGPLIFSPASPRCKVKYGTHANMVLVTVKQTYIKTAVASM